MNRSWLRIGMMICATKFINEFKFHNRKKIIIFNKKLKLSNQKFNLQKNSRYQKIINLKMMICYKRQSKKEFCKIIRKI